MSSELPAVRRRRYSEAEITRWLKERDRGSLSYRQLSERSGIPVPTLATWRRRRRLRSCEPTDFVELLPSAPSAVVVPLRDGVIRVVLRNGVRLEVERETDDLDYLARLATALEAGC